jgi:uroporphyrinogen-III synthase
MVKKGVKQLEAEMDRKVQRILITQPKPDSVKSPYFDLARKHELQLEFQPFIRLEGLASKDFRKQKVDIASYTAVIFTSRHAIDHFFRICEETKVAVSQDTKYFCITEQVALYLQKFILYRKRKVFFGADGSNKSMFDVINKHKENEKFMYPCSENQQDNEIVGWLKTHKCEFVTPFMYRTISADVKDFLLANDFDLICFFTPSGVKSLFDNLPEYQQGNHLIGAFGTSTCKAVEEAGLKLNIKAPVPPGIPSMISAIDQYIQAQAKK